jgi:hypothetical protein
LDQASRNGPDAGVAVLRHLPFVGCGIKLAQVSENVCRQRKGFEGARTIYEGMFVIRLRECNLADAYGAMTVVLQFLFT